MTECAVCLEVIQDMCRAPCGHTYCRNCILKALEARPPEWSGPCPLCRAHVSVFNLQDATGSYLARPEVSTPYGCVFVQSGRLGLASYHFDSPEDCYISYSSAPDSWRLGDGNKPPAKKPFADYSYDAETKTFRGAVSWNPTFGGMDRWDYEVVFSEDFTGVVGGQVSMHYANGRTSVQPFQPPWEMGFTRALAYLRWTPPPSTIWGSVYVQSFLYAPVLEGVASYHFDEADDCYISYAHAPSDWRLDDGSPPPKKKPFSGASFDAATRTFRGVVTWDPPFHGDARWEYEVVFSEDYGQVVGGQIRSYRRGGEPGEATPFNDPNDPHPSHNGMFYARKPGALTASARARGVVTAG